MARYLNSPKIGILCLVQIYASSAVPSSAALPVLSFIIDHMLPPDTSRPKSWQKKLHLLPTLEEFKGLAHDIPSVRPGRSLWDVFLEKLWSVDSLDALNALFTAPDQLLSLFDPPSPPEEAGNVSRSSQETIAVTRTSPVGLAVRKAHVEFTRLPFDEANALWLSFVKYRRGSFDDWHRKHSSANDLAFDANLALASRDWGNPLVRIVYGAKEIQSRPDTQSVLPSDADQLLHFQIDVMQRTGGLVPEQMVLAFRSMMSVRSDQQPMIEYVKFLRAWRSGDQLTAFDSLHSYFDHTMHNSQRSLYQYALLNLAVMQAEYGALDEAVSAMQETIKQARDNQDGSCLNFALNWMYQHTKARGVQKPVTDETGLMQSEVQGLGYLRRKAQDSQQWHLLSSTLLSEARLLLSDGGSIVPVYQKLASSGHINAENQLYPIMGSQVLFQSSLSSRLGKAQLAAMQIGSYHHCLAQFTTYEQQIKALCCSAHLKCQQGHYVAGVAMIQSLPEKKLAVLRINQYVSTYEGMLRLQHLIRLDDLIGAQLLLKSLQSLLTLDDNLQFELNMLETELLLKQANTKEAFEKVDAMDLDQQRHYSVAGTTDLDIGQRARLMVRKAELWTAVGTPERGFSIALRAAALAYAKRCLFVLWEAILTLASILSSLANYDTAYQLLESVLPRILEIDDALLAAKCWSIRADCLLGIASSNKSGSNAQQDILRASEACDRALDEYYKVEDLRGQAMILAKKSLMVQAMGEERQANEWAIRFLEKRVESRRNRDYLEAEPVGQNLIH